MTTVPLPIIAKLLDVSERRIQQLASDGIIPKSNAGQYELVPTVRGYIGYLRRNLTNENKTDTIDIRSERGRLVKAQADKTELEVEALRGTLIATEEVELLWSNLVLNFRGRILGIASKLAVQLVGKKTSEIEKILKNAHVEALIELSENVESKPNESKSITTTEAISEQSDAKSTGKAKAAAGNKNKRVGKPKPKTKQRVKRGTRRLEQ